MPPGPVVEPLDEDAALDITPIFNRELLTASRKMRVCGGVEGSSRA